MTTPKKPLVLLILDGWGYRPDMPDNAVSNAKTPVLDQLCKDYANSLISASAWMLVYQTVKWVTQK